MNVSKFQKLFETARIGPMQLKNHIIMPPMGTLFGTRDGYVSQRLIDYYEARARGGAGLIILEITAPYAPGRGYATQLMISDDKYLSGWKKLVDAIHKHGSKAAVQLHHAGRAIMTNQTGNQVVGPSPVPIMGTNEIPHELTVEEIEEITRAFAGGARRAREAGFDGVEVHGAHQYLISSFLSAWTNTRTDKYGGSIENRARFLVEVIRAIKETAGADFPVWPRLSAQEYGMENGITIEETKQVVPMAIEAGAQAIHVSAYGIMSYVMKAPSPDEPGWILPLAEEVKKVSSVPVIAVGRLDAEIAEKILEESKIDLIAIGRRLMADPELPNKAAEGRLEDVNPCIGCMECLERPMFAGEDTACVINPVMGKEGEYQLQPAAKQKKIVVVGGGPAGMETAIVAALRGHKVTLFEKESKLGGQLNVASIPPYKDDIVPYIDYMARQVDKAGVDVRLNTEATSESITAEKPDAVVIAAGGTPAIPEIPGVAGKNVATAADVLSGRADMGQNVVVIGGGMVGCEVGHFLAAKGKTVAIVEALKRLASDMLPLARKRRMDGLREKKVVMLTSTTCDEINESGVVVTTGDGNQQTLPADSVVLAVGFKPNDSLFKMLKDKVPEVYNIGDSAQVRHIKGATSDGCRVAHSL